MKDYHVKRMLFLGFAVQTRFLLNLIYGKDYRIGVMQFNSFGDVFSQTLGLLCNTENQAIPNKIVLVPTYKKIGKQKFNEELYREIKSIIELNTEHKCLKLNRVLQIFLIRILDYNVNVNLSTFVHRKLVTSAQLNLNRDDLEVYLKLLKCRDASFKKFQKRLRHFGISEDYAVVTVRSATSTKSSEPTFSERYRSSNLENFSSTLRYLSSEYDHVILISDEKLETNLAGNIIQYRFHPIRSHLMDYMIPSNTKLLIGNLYGVSDTRMLRKSGTYIAIDVPLLSLHWNINVDFALPKIITAKGTNLPIKISQIYDSRYFDRHAYTEEFENNFDFIDNSDEEIFTFIKEVCEEIKYMNPTEFGRAYEKIRTENSYLNSMGKAASILYKMPSNSGLETPIEAKISSKFHLRYRE